jgi:ribonuclease VapC
MLVIDTSALVAILRQEPEATLFQDIITADTDPMISALTWYETLIVVDAALGPAGITALNVIVANSALQIMPFDHGQASDAHVVYQRYGKGRHPAKLNLADCASYILAMSFGCPLLYKGDDFSKTDIVPAAVLPAPSTQ